MFLHDFPGVRGFLWHLIGVVKGLLEGSIRDSLKSSIRVNIGRGLGGGVEIQGKHVLGSFHP